MTDDLYERYKEALRVGHVAVLRGSLEEALVAYRAAATIAPSRALPHTSLGGVLLRLGHLEEALVAYAAAVARAPHDEGALLGQAEALTMAGQRVDAAQALTHVAEIQESAGRLPEAADTLRRALELEEAPERARHQRGLMREIRLSAGDQAAEQLLARALRLRDEPSRRAVDSGRAGKAEPIGGQDAVPTTPIAAARSTANAARHEIEPVREVKTAETAKAAETVEPIAKAEPTAKVETVPHAVTAKETPELPEWPAAEPIPVRRSFGAGRVFDPQRQPVSEATAPFEVSEPVAVAEVERPGRERTGADTSGPTEAPAAIGEQAPLAEPAEIDAKSSKPAAEAPTSDLGLMSSFEPVLAAVAVMGDPLDPASMGSVGESQHQPTGDELLAAAEAADLAGDNTALRSLLLWTSRAYAREGRFEAGLDATHRLLQRAPGDVDAHLVLVELYVARDWNALAAEKLALLGRLAELNDDDDTRKRVCTVAGRVFPKDERLGALCA
jgi:tetratricopeptide (TPR) repeat protein